MAGQALVLHLQRLIERTYDLDTGISDLSSFIIGDEGYDRFYASGPVARKVGAADPATAGTLLRTDDDGLRAALYLPDRLVENLERHDPTRSLRDENVDDFATLVEELDHLLTVADRHRSRAEMSLLELELHANVTKELTLALFVARMRGSSRLGEADRGWVRHHLFDKVEYCEEDPELRARYRDAAALAVHYLDHLRGLPAADRPVELRRFHRRSHHEKLAQITRL
jgi:hypothetical protein